MDVTGLHPSALDFPAASVMPQHLPLACLKDELAARVDMLQGEVQETCSAHAACACSGARVWLTPT
jgi:hypothetical protein